MLVKKFNVKYEPWRKSNEGDPIIFVMQPKDNWSMNELDPIDWFNDVYKKLRPLTDRKFIVRPHPNNVSNLIERRNELPNDIELQYTKKHFVGDTTRTKSIILAASKVVVDESSTSQHSMCQQDE